MVSLMLIMFVAIANLAVGAKAAIVLGDAPPLREIVDGVIYGSSEEDPMDEDAPISETAATEDNEEDSSEEVDGKEKAAPEAT